MTMSRNYYAVLGVGASASPADIRRAYQRLARQYSPDVNLWEQEARALFGEVVEAYRVLGDPMARAQYDREPSHPREQGSQGAEPPRSSGRRGDDLHLPVEVSFAQALSGLDADVQVERLSPCAACRATGTAHGSVPSACDQCGGTGAVWRGRVTLESGPCPGCSGRGVRVSEPCEACRGRGVVLGRTMVHIALPPGIDTGGQLRVAGEGHAGPIGGPRGDLVLVARVHEDPVFSRKGDNLYCDVPTTIVEAALGASIPVPGADTDLRLTLPPGTQGGQVFRLRGKGMPRLSGRGRGDLYVTVLVETPRGLDARAQELLRALDALLPENPRMRQARGGTG